MLMELVEHVHAMELLENGALIVLVLSSTNQIYMYFPGNNFLMSSRVRLHCDLNTSPQPCGHSKNKALFFLSESQMIANETLN